MQDFGSQGIVAWVDLIELNYSAAAHLKILGGVPTTGTKL